MSLIYLHSKSNITKDCRYTFCVMKILLNLSAILVLASHAFGSDGIMQEGEELDSPVEQSHGNKVSAEGLLYDPEQMRRFVEVNVESLRYTGMMNRSNLPVDLEIYGSKLKIGNKVIIKRYDIVDKKKKKVPKMVPEYEYYYADVFVPVSGTGTRGRTVKDPSNPYRTITIPGKPPRMKRKRVRQKRIVGWKKRGYKTVC